ncbi:MAG: M24 family metallopeptidase [Dehalococcoidia bacterium]
MTGTKVSSPKGKTGMSRLQKLRMSMTEKGLDGILVCQQENRRYLSGFTGSSGWLLISGREAVLTTDFRYVEQAKAESPEFAIIQTKRELRDWFPGLVADMGVRRLGFEADFVSFDSHQRLGEALKTAQVVLELVPATDLVESLRSIKEPEELALITKAVRLGDAVLEEARRLMHPGMTEKEAAWEIEKLLRQGGSEGVAFEIIVASGPNGALPHARPTDKKIASVEPVVIDMGARIGGYCSDLTRTLFLGEADKNMRKIYDIVLEAQRAAIEGVTSGMEAAQADHLARSVLERAGHGDQFGHGLGHGVGLAVHELPTVGPASTGALAEDMVFTIEPGIYLPGAGGVRIEDIVVLENQKARVLTGASKDL